VNVLHRSQWLALSIALSVQIGAAHDALSLDLPTLSAESGSNGCVRLNVGTPATASRTTIETSTNLWHWGQSETITGGGILATVEIGADGPWEFFRARTEHCSGTLGNLWCLGDSWTACLGGLTWRRNLWQDLTDAGWVVDFVGTVNDQGACDSGDASFDDDHNGISGVEAAQVATDYLAGWLQDVTPDTVLLLLGGNDLLRNPNTVETVIVTVGHINSIIDQLRIVNPNVVIHVGVYGYVDRPQSLPDWMMDNFATRLQLTTGARTTAESPLYFVDHRVGWDRSIHLSGDGLHPNSLGLEKVADNWFASICANQADTE